MKIITFLSDFGTSSSYVAQMKGAVSSICDARLIDITHGISSHNIREGAFLLQNVVSYYPVGTVHVAVVDPGVGTERKGLVIATKTQILVGPDNGLLILAARSLGDFVVYEIKNKKYMLSSVSNTFHGRDIFSPVAAHIINGVTFEEIGTRIYDFVDLDFGSAKFSDKSASGKVIYVGKFGNIVTNIKGQELLNFIGYNKKIMVDIGGSHREMFFVKSYGFVEKGEMLLTIGSSDFIEISLNQGDATEKLSVKVDDAVKILF